VALGETSCENKYPEKVIKGFLLEALFDKKIKAFPSGDSKCLENYNPAGAELEKKLKKEKQNKLVDKKEGTEEGKYSLKESSSLNVEESFDDSDLESIDGVEIKKKNEKE